MPSAPVKKSDRSSVPTKIYAIAYSVSWDEDEVYVKMQRLESPKRITWHVTPVQTYEQASKYATREQAERAIRGIPDFNGWNSLTARVVIE
jgi:hypothetical protein